jgi:hypothetical protein
LLLGAEINAFFAEKIHATPDNLAAMVHQLTSHLPTSKKDMQEQATPSHRNVEPKDIRSESQPSNQETQAAQPSQLDTSNRTNHAPQNIQKNKRQSSSQSTSPAFILAETLAGTALAFAVQFFNLKRKK